MTTKNFVTTGRRKEAIAKASIREGKGIIRINSRLLSSIEPEFLQQRISEPLIIAGDLAKRVDIKIRTCGGGIQAQTEAARLAIARALFGYSKDKKLKEEFLKYDRHLLVADVRVAESSKPNDSKPRAKRQKSYR